MPDQPRPITLGPGTVRSIPASAFGPATSVGDRVRATVDTEWVGVAEIADPDLSAIKAGTEGVVEFIDSHDTVFVLWANGYSSALFPYIDRWELVEPQ